MSEEGGDVMNEYMVEFTLLELRFACIEANSAAEAREIFNTGEYPDSEPVEVLRVSKAQRITKVRQSKETSSEVVHGHTR